MAAREVIVEEKCFEVKGTAVNITMPENDLKVDLRLTLKFGNIAGND